jgi:hypothetical protein
MTASPRTPDKFAIVPIYADSSGAEVKFPDAIMTGSMSAVMARIKDTKQMREDIRISNEADLVRRAKADLNRDRAAFKADQAAFEAEVEQINEVLLHEFFHKLDALTARLDAYEAERNHDPDDDELPLPPGISADDGDLQASHDPSSDKHREQLEDDNEGDLPPELERHAPPGLGTDPVFNPAELAHPQKPPQQPVAFGGDSSDLEDLPSPPGPPELVPLPVADRGLRP